MREIGTEHRLQRQLRLFGGEPGEYWTTDFLIFAEAAAHEDVIAFDAFALDFDHRGEQADIAHVMLGAGMRAAGQMHVDGLVELHPLFEIGILAPSSSTVAQSFMIVSDSAGTVGDVINSS